MVEVAGSGPPKKHRFEGAHKADAPAVDGAYGADGADGVTAAGATQKRSINEAGHKLSDRSGPARSAVKDESEDTRQRFAALADSNRDVIGNASRLALALGALGVVYGDIGTSPLYTEQTIFTSYKATHEIVPVNVYGPASLIFWALMIVVSIKYAGFIMRAHNRGDGGIMALAALLQRSKVARGALLATLGIFGAGLFFGDGIITPAISVLGAVAGVQVATPALSHLIVPLSVAILIGLFVLQRFGSGTIGVLFGPVMLVWFAVIALLGLGQVVHDPAVFQALSPSWAVRFMVDHGANGYLTLGGVVLAVTGAEALYADRGHFGATPIRIGWFFVALPALLFNYLGQAAWILHHPHASRASNFNPFFQIAPHWSLWPMVVLATVATVIASQAAISGSFSVARQAVQLGFLPRLKVVHTSVMEGQIYVPLVNWALCIGVVALTLVVRSATKLGDIYGVAVTGTFILNTLLFTAVARLLWRTPWWKIGPLAALFLCVEVAFFSANIAKITHGAWFSLAIGAIMSVIMITWRRGQVIVTRNRVAQEGSLHDFLDELPAKKPPLVRVPGVAVFLNPSKDTTPLALRAEVEHTHTLHQKVVIVSVSTVSIPTVGHDECFRVEWLGHGLYKIFHVTARLGYQDKVDVPALLRLARKQGLLERNLDIEHASYFVSRITITESGKPGLAGWRKALFIAMARNAASPIDHFGLPGDRTVMMGSQVAL
ncbi:MAG TPA: KUP/HAK/KT family potassium transporter [Solirubrobacteraceae bacterium]|nr:KUP/HAK/KT family potassium transporter [Solirubrobacteraceae bacterium]